MTSTLAFRLSLAIGLAALAACEPDTPNAQDRNLFAEALEQDAAEASRGYAEPAARAPTPAYRSAGAADPAPPTLDALTQATLRHNGREREYLYYAPPQAADGPPLPLLLAFHGGGGAAESFAATARFHDMAAREGFIVAYPQGLGRNGNGGTWNTGDGAPSGYAARNAIDDVGFVAALIDRLSAQLPVDPKQVFATGMSRGGMLSYRLACELSGRITAIAPVAGVLTLPDCRPQHPVGLLHIHGDRDQHVPFDGGRGQYTARLVEKYRPVKEGIEILRRISGADTEIRSQRLSDDTQCYYYGGGAAPIGYCIVAGGGHAWPGSEKKRWQEMRNVQVTRSFNVTELIWGFFKQSAKDPQPEAAGLRENVFDE